MVLRGSRAELFFPLTVTILSLLAATSFASRERSTTLVWNAPTVHVVWYDAYRLFPAAGLETMRLETEGLFARSGISVQVHVAVKRESFEDLVEPRINAVLIPSEGASWGLAGNTMAAAIGDDQRRPSIFVFFPGVLRTLGQVSARLSPREVSELARAMGRILAHELVHVLAPERGHAEQGLMASRLGRKLLLAKPIELDAMSRRVAREALVRWSESKEEIVATEASESEEDGRALSPVPAAPPQKL